VNEKTTRKLNWCGEVKILPEFWAQKQLVMRELRAAQRYCCDVTLRRLVCNLWHFEGSCSVFATSGITSGHRVTSQSIWIFSRGLMIKHLSVWLKRRHVHFKYLTSFIGSFLHKPQNEVDSARWLCPLHGWLVNITYRTKSLSLRGLVMSVCPHAATRLPLDGFWCNLILELFFANLWRKFKFH
jgi:hypothetical protein